MKTSIAKLALGLTLVSVSGVAMAGISATKHNLGSSGTFNFTSSTTEICVFCHTPHGADSSSAAPLWNRSLSTSASYNTYSSLGTTTMDTESAGIGSVSLACLSCHDGTQAMNTVINSPGGGTTGDVNFDGTNYISSASGADCSAVDGTCGGFNEFNYMSQVSFEMIYLSTDLRNDHPISIQYAGALTGGTQARAAKDGDFFAATFATVGGGQQVYYIDTGTPGTKEKTDLPLYNRTTGTLAGQALVECATCHDPHTSVTATFLRNPSGNDGSATCLSCHNK
jgi:predicted CXXCH cytochrome family protein